MSESPVKTHKIISATTKQLKQQMRAGKRILHEARIVQPMARTQTRTRRQAESRHLTDSDAEGLDVSNLCFLLLLLLWHS